MFTRHKVQNKKLERSQSALLFRQEQKLVNQLTSTVLFRTKPENISQNEVVGTDFGFTISKAKVVEKEKEKNSGIVAVYTRNRPASAVLSSKNENVVINKEVSRIIRPQSGKIDKTAKPEKFDSVSMKMKSNVYIPSNSQHYQKIENVTDVNPSDFLTANFVLTSKHATLQSNNEISPPNLTINDSVIPSKESSEFASIFDEEVLNSNGSIPDVIVPGRLSPSRVIGHYKNKSYLLSSDEVEDDPDRLFVADASKVNTTKMYNFIY